jgi:hypothetical protein
MDELEATDAFRNGSGELASKQTVGRRYVKETAVTFGEAEIGSKRSLYTHAPVAKNRGEVDRVVNEIGRASSSAAAAVE